MDFLYRSIHMEQKKWEASTQMTIEEDVNVPDAKEDCLMLLLKDAALHVEETRVGRDQVVVKGCLQYQILYETGKAGCLEQLTGAVPFEEVLNVNGAVPGDLAKTKWVIEDFKAAMINTRKLAIQSVVLLHVCMEQLVEEEWTDDVVNCEKLEKRFEEKEVLQLCQKKSDVFRIKEELELPAGYPAVQKVLWQHTALGNLEIRPMDGKVSIKGELSCCFIYAAQGVNAAVKIFTKKVAFHGLLECSGCKNDMNVSMMPILGSCLLEVKPDSDGEDRLLYLEASLELTLRVYGKEKVSVLRDVYSTVSEVSAKEKTVHAPLLSASGEGKCKLKYTHHLNEGTPKAVQLLHTLSHVFPDREVWENGNLQLTGAVQLQILYQTGEEEMPYAVTECMVPYAIEMEGNAGCSNVDSAERSEAGSMGYSAADDMRDSKTGSINKPDIHVEPRIELSECSLVDSEEMEWKGIVCFTVLAVSREAQQCVDSAECKPLDAGQFAALPGMVVCFAQQDTPLWDYGKKYYMPTAEMKQLNNLSADVLKAGERMLLVKGADGGKCDKP